MKKHIKTSESLGGYPPFSPYTAWGDRTSDLQKSRHLQKGCVTGRHNRGTKRKLKSHQAQKKALRAFFGAGGATSIFALCPDCAAP